MNIIEVQNLSKTYLIDKVLDNISFTVQKGSFAALLGKNGVGKSTILDILMGQTKLDEGDCLIFGESIKGDTQKLKNKIGYVSEKINFNYPLSVEKFIKKFGLLYDNFDFDLFFSLLSKVNIDPSKLFEEYSRGQKMQIVLIAALAHHPELLLIDEVTSVLDAYSRKFFMTVLKEFTENGGTVVLTTNIVNEVQNYCTDVIFVSNHKIKFQTPLKDIPENFSKIRKTKDSNHAVFESNQCIWAGINSDGSQSYIIPKPLYQSMQISNELNDRRAVTLEDLYIFYSQSSEA